LAVKDAMQANDVTNRRTNAAMAPGRGRRRALRPFDTSWLFVRDSRRADETDDEQRAEREPDSREEQKQHAYRDNS
jgi:hypothetical protein